MEGSGRWSAVCVAEERDTSGSRRPGRQHGVAGARQFLRAHDRDGGRGARPEGRERDAGHSLTITGKQEKASRRYFSAIDRRDVDPVADREENDHMRADESRPEEAGDPVCWLAATCAECGAFVESDRCWRCGAPRKEDR